MANLSAIKLPNGTTYTIKDNNALPLTGGSVTGPVSFGDSVTIDDLTAGQLVVDGALSVANNLQAYQINGVTVGTSPKFTDTVTTVSVTGTGNAVTAASASNGAVTLTKGATFLTAHNTYTVSTTGSGNAVTAVSLSGTTLTVTKGTTFSTTDTNTWRNIKVNGTEVLGTGISSGAVNFKQGTGINITNSSGTLEISSTVVNTDSKLALSQAASGTTLYPVIGSGTTAAERCFDTTGFVYTGTNGTTSAVGSSILTLGNSTASGTAGNKQGIIKLYTRGVGELRIQSEDGYAPAAARTRYLPSYDADMYLVGTITTNAVGSTSQPVYIDSAGAVSVCSSIPTSAASKVTGITASTTATKTTLGTAFSIPNVTSVGSASTWAFEDIACDDITSWSAGSASSWAFTGVTAATGTINATVSGEAEDTLTISLATTTVQSKSSGSNGTAPSLSYTARTVSSKKSGSNGTAPTLGTAFSVPNVTGNTSATVSITDPGHTHTLS